MTSAMLARARPLLPALGVAAFSLLLRAPLASIPLERDEGEYAYIAQRWLAGEVPFAHSFDQKPPGAMALYALIFGAFGETPAALRWGAALLSLITLACTGQVAKRLGGDRAALAASTFLAFLLAERSLLGQSVNTELFVALFASAGLLATLIALERGAAWALCAGLLLGASVLCKPVAATCALFCLGLSLWRRRADLLLAQLLGLMIPIALTALYFAHHGALHDLLDATVYYNLGYSREVSPAYALERLRDTYLPILASTWPLHLLALAPLVRKTPGARFASLFLAASLLGVVTGGHFREHYFLQAAPAFALSAALGLAALPLRAVASMGLAAAAIALGLAVNPGYWLPGDPTGKARAIYGANPFPESAAAGALLSRLLAPDARIFVLGSEPELLFAARRASSTRYIFLYPLANGTSDASARQQQAIAELRASPPQAVVTVFQSTSIHEGDEQIDPALFEYTRQLLQSGYRVAAVAPFATGELLAGDEAAALWRAHPFWYGEPAWASLAVFVREQRISPNLF